MAYCTIEVILSGPREFRNPVVRVPTKDVSPCPLRPARVSQSAHVRARWLYHALYSEKPPVPLLFRHKV